jgi:rhamnogalacturonyl hydrolase YesR
MEKIFIRLLTLLITFLLSPWEADSAERNRKDSLDREKVIQIMEKVADWQIANQHTVKSHDLRWTNATLYIGMLEWSKIAETDKYRQWLLDIGKRHGWQPHHRMYNADDVAVCQMYLDLYRLEGDKRMFSPTQARTEWVINHPSIANFKHGGGEVTTERWTWCDALFMAPPVYIQMYNLTGDAEYLGFFDREFHMTYDLLYDAEEQLFFRDHRYFDQKEKNGEKIFWGRGNGWVLGGLVKILKELPEHAYIRDFYEKLFVEMCEKVARLQDDEGYWHASLLDRASYPNPETSSSGFFTYALAYGINSGLLNKEQYLPAVKKGWRALEEAVFPDGKLGWVQPVGVDPQVTVKEMTEVYGVGAFLLAGSEIYRLAETTQKH